MSFGDEISNSIESYIGVKLYLHYIGNDIWLTDLSPRLQNSIDTKAEDQSKDKSKIQKMSVGCITGVV